MKNGKDILPNSFKNTKLFVELIWISSTSCQGHPINNLFILCALIENGLKLDPTWVQRLYLVWNLNPKDVLKEWRRKVKTVEHPFLSNSKNHYGDSEMYVQTDKRITEKSFFEKLSVTRQLISEQWRIKNIWRFATRESIFLKFWRNIHWETRKKYRMEEKNISREFGTYKSYLLEDFKWYYWENWTLSWSIWA